MDAGTITAIAGGIALVLKALAVLVTAVRRTRAPTPSRDATQDDTPAPAGV